MNIKLHDDFSRLVQKMLRCSKYQVRLEILQCVCVFFLLSPLNSAGVFPWASADQKVIYSCKLLQQVINEELKLCTNLFTLCLSASVILLFIFDILSGLGLLRLFIYIM